MNAPKVTWGLFHSRSTGLVHGQRCELYSSTAGSGKSRTTWCAVSEMPRADGGLTFTFSRQGLLSTVKPLFGAKDMEAGDKSSVDRAWFIETNQADFIRAGLLPELREKFRRATHGSPSPSLQLAKGVVRDAERGTFRTEDRCARLEKMAEVICDFSDLAEIFTEEERSDASA